MRRPVSIALVASSLALTSCGGNDASRPSAPATSIATGGPVRVPWADLPATHPRIPSTRVRARPDPAVAQTARPCRAGDLVLSRVSTGAAAGTMVKNLRFSLTHGHTPCAVSGRPGLTVLTTEGITIPGRLDMWTPYWHPVLLSPTSSALVQLVWPSACYARSGRASATLTYAGRRWVVPMGVLSAHCDYGPDHPLRSVGITHFAPPVRRPAHLVTAYSHVRIRAPAQIVTHADRPISFVITLIPRREITLDPCPDYSIGHGEGDDVTQALNCAAVPYRDARGRPYLPANRPVRFEMRMDPVDSFAKYVWRIVAPGFPPYAGGVVVVR